jgi:flavoprotein
MGEKRIAWAITGAGHALEDCVQLLLKCEKVDIFLSRAADEVVRKYKLHLGIDVPTIRTYREVKSSSPLVARLFTGAYSVLVIAPATSNSVAKFVHGIADTLVTNLFAQAGKSRVPVIVYPTDLGPQMDSLDPHRETVRVYPRPIDLENTAKLRTFPGVEVVGSREELEKCLAAYL